MGSYGEQDMNELKSVDIRNVDKGSLVDLDSVQIDESKPVQERVLSFLEQVQNPYCFRIGDVAVKVNYKSDGPSFQQNFEDLIADLEASRVTIEKERAEIEQYKNKNKMLNQQLARKQERLDENRDKIIREANEKAAAILREAKDYADATIRNFQKYGAATSMKEMVAKFPSRLVRSPRPKILWVTSVPGM